MVTFAHQAPAQYGRLPSHFGPSYGARGATVLSTTRLSLAADDDRSSPLAGVDATGQAHLSPRSISTAFFTTISAASGAKREVSISYPPSDRGASGADSRPFRCSA